MKTALIGVPALLLFAQPAEAATQLLSFDGNICRNGQLCRNNDTIDDSYGDTEGVDVTIRSMLADGPYPGFFYGSGYGDLTNIVYSGEGQISFDARPGYEVALSSFDAGCFGNLADCRTFSYDFSVDGRTVNRTPAAATEFPGHYSASFAPIFGQSVRLNFGNSFNLGLDNIRFDYRPAVSPVPELSSWAMMILGFGLMGASLKRARVKQMRML